MQQMNIPEDKKILIDYEDAGWPETARRLRPVVWFEDDCFYALLGPDKRKGILGNGKTAMDAIADWHEALHRRTRCAASDDELAQYVLDSMRASVYKIM